MDFPVVQVVQTVQKTVEIPADVPMMTQRQVLAVQVAQRTVEIPQAQVRTRMSTCLSVSNTKLTRFMVQKKYRDEDVKDDVEAKKGSENSWFTARNVHIEEQRKGQV